MAGNIGDAPWEAEAAIDELAAAYDFPSVGTALAAIELTADPLPSGLYGTAEVAAE